METSEQAHILTSEQVRSLLSDVLVRHVRHSGYYNPVAMSRAVKECLDNLALGITPTAPTEEGE